MSLDWKLWEMRKILLKEYHSILYFSSLKSSVGGHCSIKWTFFFFSWKGSSYVIKFQYCPYFLRILYANTYTFQIHTDFHMNEGLFFILYFLFWESDVSEPSLLERCTAVNKLCVSDSDSVYVLHVSCWVTVWHSHWLLVFSFLSGKLFWLKAILFCISMYYLQRKNSVWKAGETAMGWS